MQKTIGVLAVLLVAQLLLAGGMRLTGPSLAPVRPDTPLIDLDGATVDRLTIEGSDEERLVLARQGEAWVLPEAGEFPADGAKVERLLERLVELKRGMPVATSPGALERFKVSDGAFERRLVLATGDETLATLYLGTSSGVREVHLRTSEDDAVYAAELGVHEAPAKAADWEDKTVLQIPQAEIEKIILSYLTLTRRPGNVDDDGSKTESVREPAPASWVVEALAEGETLNQTNAEALVEKLASLRIGSVLGSEPEPGYGLDEPELVLGVERKGGEHVEYRLGKREEDGDYALKSSARAEYFRLPAYTGDALVKAAERDQLVSTKAEADGTEAVDSEQTESSSGEVAPRSGERAAAE